MYGVSWGRLIDEMEKKQTVRVMTSMRLGCFLDCCSTSRIARVGFVMFLTSATWSVASHSNCLTKEHVMRHEMKNWKRGKTNIFRADHFGKNVLPNNGFSFLTHYADKVKITFTQSKKGGYWRNIPWSVIQKDDTTTEGVGDSIIQKRIFLWVTDSFFFSDEESLFCRLRCVRICSVLRGLRINCAR